jgi:hypothetical protein
MERHPERVAIDRAYDRSRESALRNKAGAYSPGRRIAKGYSTCPGPGPAAARRSTGDIG